MLVIIVKCCIFIICMLPVRTTLHSCLITFAAFWRRSLGKLASFCSVMFCVNLYSSVIFILICWLYYVLNKIIGPQILVGKKYALRRVIF